MLRRSWLILIAAGLLPGAILPDKLGSRARSSVAPAAIEDRALWDEYGLVGADKAEYGGLSVTAYRMKDPTGALAVYQWLRPAAATRSKIATWAVVTPDAALVMHGNYVLQFAGERPDKAAVDALLAALPQVSSASLPSLWNYVPPQKLVRNSERYIVGPVSLERFEPRISASVAGFHLGAEGQVARYGREGSESTLAVFSYPTPAMARERARAFESVQGVTVKRSGPIVAAVLGAAAAEAGALLEQVKYQPNLSWTEAPPPPVGNPGEMILAIMVLAGALIVMSIFLGFFLGGARVVLRRFGIDVGDTTVTALNLSRDK